MSNEDFEAIKKIWDRINIWDDGIERRAFIAETLLRIPESAKEKVLKDAVFVTMSGTYGAFLIGVPSELKSEDQLIKGSDGLTHVKIEVPLIFLNFALMEKDGVDEEERRSNVAHEIAHFILGHKFSGGREKEKEADDLIEKWGFKRAYQSYERFARS